MVSQARPKSGVYASAPRPTAPAENLSLVLRGQQPRVFRPSRRALQLDQYGKSLCHRILGWAIRGGRLGMALEGLDRPRVHGAVPCSG